MDKELEDKLKQDLKEYRELKTTGARPNNISVGLDIQSTIKHVVSVVSCILLGCSPA